MENIDLIIYLAIAGIILPFFFPLVYLPLIIVERSKLSKITNIQEFKDNIRIWVKNRKIPVIKKWFKRGDTLTTTEIMDRIRKEEEKLKEAIRYFFIALAFPLFGVYVSLIKVVGNYYIKVKTDYVIPHTFPKAEAFTLIALSVWIGVVLCLKLFHYRINMYLKKIKELEYIES